MAIAMCSVCGGIGMSNGGDGFFYCVTCGTQSQDLREEALADEEMVYQGIYSASYKRSRAAPIQSQADLDIQTQAKVLAKMQQVNMTGGEHSARPLDFADADDEGQSWRFGSSAARLDPEALASQIRERYVEGMQRMIQMQCEALVEKFGATPLICGTVAPIWLRYVASTRVFQRGWAKEALQAAEALHEERSKGKDPCEDHRHRRSSKFNAEPRTSYGEKAQRVWVRSLKDRIPVVVSLAISFLACHMAREVILPTDVIKWVLEGKIPYLAAFMDIEKSLGDISKPWPFSPRFLFRPNQVLGSRQLELMSACIAKRIGLQLPPVNFHAISRCFLKQLQLPVEKIFPFVERMYEWSPPPGLWLSVDPNALPTRIYVMGLLVIVIRILYNINGQGYWEGSLATNSRIGSVQCGKSFSKEPSQDQFEGKLDKFPGNCVNGANVEDYRCFSAHPKETAATGISTSSTGNSTSFHDCELDATTLLQNLESWNRDNDDQLDYARDLPTYLRYCKDVIFVGSNMSYDEENLIKHFWQLYEKFEKEDLGTVTREPECSTRANGNQVEGMKPTNEHIPSRKSSSCENQRDTSLESIIFDMEKDGFEYIPPTKECPPDSYLRYRKKNISGTLKGFVHADYYILLRACARVIKVDAYALHCGIWKLEKRVGWIEDRVQEVICAISKHEHDED